VMNFRNESHFNSQRQNGQEQGDLRNSLSEGTRVASVEGSWEV
jgi:hypothetical protein